MVNYIINIVKGKPKGDRTKTIREVVGTATNIKDARKKSIEYIKKSNNRRFTVLTVKANYHPKIGDRFISEIRSMDEINEEFAFGTGDAELVCWVSSQKEYYISKPPIYDEYVVNTEGKILYKVSYW